MAAVGAEVYIIKVLDHCGCAMGAKFINNKPTYLRFQYVCPACCESLDIEKLAYYYDSCFDDITRYQLKQLLDTKGWINYSAYTRLMASKKQNLNIFVENSQKLEERIAPKEAT